MDPVVNPEAGLEAAADPEVEAAPEPEAVAAAPEVVAAPEPAHPAPAARPPLARANLWAADDQSDDIFEATESEPPGSLELPATGRRGRILFAIVGAVAAFVIVASILAVTLLSSSTGRVFFSRTAYDQGSKTCQFGSPISGASTADQFYMIASFSDTMDAKATFSLAITRDGVPFEKGDATIGSGFNCYVEADALGPLGTGVYKFTFTHDGKVEAEGSITVTAASPSGTAPASPSGTAPAAS